MPNQAAMVIDGSCGVLPGIAAGDPRPPGERARCPGGPCAALKRLDRYPGHATFH
jgi:hypothetical protein